MPGPPPIGHEKPPKVLGPIWVISLFLGLSEVAATVGLTQASGWIQAMLALFAVLFPTLIAVAFFLILWFKNKVLYAPGDFTKDTRAGDFADAMDRVNRNSAAAIESTLNALATKLDMSLATGGATPGQRDEIRDLVRTAARESVVTVDLSAFYRERHTMEVPFTENTTVTDLLDAVYFTIYGLVENYSYGKTWLLRGANARLLDNIGRPYARRYLGTERDFRLLSEVGIEPGSTLTIVDRRT